MIFGKEKSEQQQTNKPKKSYRSLITISMKPYDHKKFTWASKSRGLSLSAFLVMCAYDYVDRHQGIQKYIEDEMYNEEKGEYPSRNTIAH
jgi:hypothetical protein